MPPAYEGSYEVDAGIWGETIHTTIQFDTSQDVTLVTQRGYDDDFDLDLGWTIGGNATEGRWARGVPSSQLLFDMWQCGSPTDSPYDPGENVYSTGLSSNPDVSIDEVSGGTTWLSSPVMNLDSINIPTLSFDYWLCEFPPNQYLGFTTWVSNGNDTFLIKDFRSDTTIGVGTWNRFYTPLGFFGPKDNVQILFIATDTTSGNGDYYLKVHVDNFKMTDGTLGTQEEWISTKHFLIYPNPVNGSNIYLKPENGIEGNELSLKIFDIQGRVITSYHISKITAETGLPHALDNGVYFLQWITDKGEYGVEKVMVMKN
jgi:hypothetical protein